MKTIKSCKLVGHKPKGSATVHDGGSLRSVCAGCGAPLALKIGGWKEVRPPVPDAGGPKFTQDRRKGPRRSILQRSSDS